ncbi:MAG: triose-phosphate isomerase [Synechococcus sp.]
MRQIVLAGNWKMHMTQAETRAYLDSFLPQIENLHPARQVLLCVPFTDLTTALEATANSPVKISAQNVHWEEKGAFTGEISASMLSEMGIQFVVIGHSERREYFGETDATVNKRLLAAQKAGITPILCVGESKATRDAGDTEAWIFRQLEEDLVGVDQNNLIIAYEPIWAIGTGDTCDSGEANRIIGLIRSKLSNKDVPIQYGGSVKPTNVDEIMAQPQIDGALVGGGSLTPDSFARIANYQVI